VQVKTVVSIIMRRYELRPLGPLPKPNYKVMVVGPEPPNRVAYRRRKEPLQGPFSLSM
jgi:hypothetical protein